MGGPDSQGATISGSGYWSGGLARLAIVAVPFAVPTGSWAQAAGDVGGSLFSGGGSLRSTVEGLMPNRPRVNTGLAWTTSGGIDVQLGVTDNPGGLNNQHKWSFTTLIQPSLNLEGSSARVSAQLGYTPQLVLYTNASSQNRLSHNLNANADVVVVPDHLFLNVRAVAADQPTYGSNSAVLANQQSAPFFTSTSASQTASVSFSPYYQQRFGGWATLQVGYALSHTFQDNSNNGGSIQQTNGLPGYGTTGSLTSHQEYVNLTTGENFNRFQYSLSASTSQYTGGSALYQGGGNYNVNNTLSYALTRGIALVGTVGYQTVAYGGTSSFQSDYVNWTVGTRLTPNADSSLTVQYGASQGSSTWLFNGNYTPTPRLSFYGSYNTAITTYLQQQQALLQTTVVGPNGVLLDRTTGAPLSATNPFGIQNSPSRVDQLSIGASFLLNRDTFSTSIARYKTTTLTNSSTAIGTTIPVGTSGTGTTGTLSWQHDLNPVTNITTSVSYGVDDNGAFLGSPGTSQRTFSAGANLFRTFTESLTGNVSYSYNERSGVSGTTIQGAGNASQNLFLIGLRKIF